MRVHILSDLHLEFAPFEPAPVEADVIVLAGDLHPGDHGLAWITQTYPRTPVIYVLGNHEFYGQKTPKLIHELREQTAGTQVHVLEDASARIDGVTFLGTTLWTDFALLGNPDLAEIDAAFGMNDFRHIRVTPSYRRFRPEDARRLNYNSIRWLETQFAALAGQKSVVVTHHAPSARSISPRHANDPLSPAFASNLDDLVLASRTSLWVHGHIHDVADYTLGSTRVIANPRGYPGEAVPGFNPALVVEV